MLTYLQLLTDALSQLLMATLLLPMFLLLLASLSVRHPCFCFHRLCCCHHIYCYLSAAFVFAVADVPANVGVSFFQAYLLSLPSPLLLPPHLLLFFRWFSLWYYWCSYCCWRLCFFRRPGFFFHRYLCCYPISCCLLCCYQFCQFCCCWRTRCY